MNILLAIVTHCSISLIDRLRCQEGEPIKAGRIW